MKEIIKFFLSFPIHLYGLHKNIFHSIKKANKNNNNNIDFCNSLFSNILLSGASAMFEGIKKRIEAEVVKLAPKDIKVN